MFVTEKGIFDLKWPLYRLQQNKDCYIIADVQITGEMEELTMAKKWTDDAALLEQVACNIVETLPLFPKRIVRVDALTREQSMPLSHIQILISLRKEELSIGELSDRLGIAKPNITPLVDSLCASGLVERVRNETDRRVVNVRLTDAGFERVAQLEECVARQVRDWSTSFSRSEIKELSGALASLSRIANQM